MFMKPGTVHMSSAVLFNHTGFRVGVSSEIAAFAAHYGEPLVILLVC